MFGRMASSSRSGRIAGTVVPNSNALYPPAMKGPGRVVVLLSGVSAAMRAAIEAGGGEISTATDPSDEPAAMCGVVAGEDALRAATAWRDDPRTFSLPILALVDHPAERAYRDVVIAGADDAIVHSDPQGITRRIAALGADRKAPLAPRGTVTIVDPDVARRRRFGRALSRSGLEVRFASEFEEMASDAPDVVVVHHSLSDTRDVHHVARDRLGHLGLPVVVIAGQQDGEREGRRVERTATVPENVPADHLLFVVNELLNPGAAEHRASARLLFATLCAFRRRGDLVPSYGLTHNISRDGIFVRTLDPPPIGSEVWLEMRPPYAIHGVHLGGVVAWRTQSIGSSPAGFAMQVHARKCAPQELELYRRHYSRLHEDAPLYGLGAGDHAPRDEPSDGRIRLLIADDEDMILRAFARVFEKAGVDVTLARDGQEAVELFRAQRHDAVLTDINMPKLSGIELLKAIRADDESVPVIITTGEPTVETAVQALESGAIRYLAKPVDMEEAKQAIEDAVTMSRLANFRRQAAWILAESNSGETDQLTELDDGLSRAILSLQAHYQPIVDWPSRRIIAYEALARTSEPSIPHPGALFDAAERLDRLPDVARRMRGLCPLPWGDRTENLFMNVHPADLLDEQLFDPSSALAAMADRVVLEITERASLQGVVDLRSRIGRLRELGFRIAVDDLGAGYAGLTTFCVLDPEVVKLDMSLVRGVHESVTKQRLIRSMSELCGDLGMDVIAEGVETQLELDALLSLGCKLFQGYFFARPGPAFPEVRWPES